MAEGLPEGLISTNEAVTDDVQGFEDIDVDIIRKFWKGMIKLPSPSSEAKASS